MNRQTLLKHDNYIIVQHSHYPTTKIYRKNHYINHMFACQHTFDLTGMLCHNYIIPTIS